MDRLALRTPPCGVVHAERQHRVVDAELAREDGLRHRGHADHRAAVPLEPIDLGDRLETGPLRSAADRRLAMSSAENGSANSACITPRPPPPNVDSRPHV